METNEQHIDRALTDDRARDTGGRDPDYGYRKLATDTFPHVHPPYRVVSAQELAALIRLAYRATPAEALGWENEWVVDQAFIATADSPEQARRDALLYKAARVAILCLAQTLVEASRGNYDLKQIAAALREANLHAAFQTQEMEL